MRPESPVRPVKAGLSGVRSGVELVVLIVLAMTIALLIKTFVVQAFFIPSSSMETTLLIGDKVLVNKLVYHLRPIKPGDIIVFDGAGSWVAAARPAKASSDPVVRVYDDTLQPLFHSIGGLFGTAPGQTDFIKRVIGVPGDHVACCNAQGLITVNGVALHEKSYLYPGAAPSEIRFNVMVPPGRLWVMGDNRQVSDDSRLHSTDPGDGTIPENKVIGRAFMIVWPPQPLAGPADPRHLRPARDQQRRRGGRLAGDRHGRGRGAVPAAGGRLRRGAAADLAAATGARAARAAGAAEAAVTACWPSSSSDPLGYTPRRDSGLAGYERILSRAGLAPVAGIDEAGRGACAGPLVVAAAILRPSRSAAVTGIPGLADSKALTAQLREEIYEQIVQVGRWTGAW